MTKENTKTTGIEKGAVDRDSDEAQGRGFKGSAGGKTGGVDLATRTIQGIASTINLDRDGEVILPSAFRKDMPRFLAGNSAFLDAHQHRGWGGNGPTQIGWTIKMSIEATQVKCSFRFVEDDDQTSPANRWWKLAKDPNGKGIAFSIGFIPRQWIAGTAGDIAREFPELRKPLKDAGLKDEDRLRVYTEIELLEISAVPVPSNREAMQLLAAKAASKNGEKALDEFEDAVAQKVVEKLGDSETSTGAAAEIKSSIEKIKTRQSEILDKLSELAEVIELSSDTLGQVPPVTETPRPEVKESAEHDDGPGAELKDAAEGLLKTCTD